MGSAVAAASILITAGVVAAAPFSEAWSRQPGLRKRFPRFAEHKPTIGSITIVADVVQFHGPDRIYLGESRDLSRRLGDALVRELTHSGYRVVAGPTLSIGLGADDDARCRVISVKEREDAEWDSARPVAPPYDLDTTRIAGDTLRTAWRHLVRRTMHGAKPDPGDSAAVVMMRPVLGGDAILVAAAVGGDRPALSFEPTSPQSMASRAVVNASRVRIALFDARTGAVLWADATDDMRDFSPKRMDAMGADLAAQLP